MYDVKLSFLISSENILKKPFVKKYLFYYFILWQKNGVAGTYSNHSLFMGASDLAFIFSYLSTMDQDSKISSKKSRASWSYWKWGLELFTEWRKSFMFKGFAWLSKSKAHFEYRMMGSSSKFDGPQLCSPLTYRDWNYIFAYIQYSLRHTFDL